MNGQHHNNKRIVKNTLFLYVRQLFSLVVSLLTSGIVLRTLGVEDYGVYNLVGGIVTLFTFINGAMSSSTQRFLNFEMGRGNTGMLSNVFSLSMSIHVIITLIVFVLAETIGLWFVNSKLVIPAERMVAANVVYQLSVVTAMISITQTPYTATIISYERMNIYGYVGMAEVLARLLLLGLLILIPWDKLILYAVLVFTVGLLVAVYYRIYCIRNFAECRYRFLWDKPLFNKFFSFTSWTMIGGMAGSINTQGQSIILNLFFGTALNAAQGIADSVNNAISNFVNNFTIALNPQIIKSYATGDRLSFLSLIYRGAKFSFYIYLLFAVPILIYTPYILKLWLKIPPDYAAIFCRFVIVNSMINCFSNTLMTAVRAYGRVKVYQIIVGGINLFMIPVVYLCIKLMPEPEIVYYVAIAFSLILLFFRVVVLKGMVGISPSDFFVKVVFRCFCLSVISFLIPVSLAWLFPQNIISVVCVSLLSITITLVAIYYWGIASNERLFIKKILFNVINKIINKKDD